MSCRVRFAPSPTGPLHIGGLRTALYNYLFAKINKGSFILRIEDTDQNRHIKTSENYIDDSLIWTGLIPDESPKKGGKYGPYKQSERKSLYKKYVSKLIETEKAYYAFDTDEELNQLRIEYHKKGFTFKYDYSNRETLKNSLNFSNKKIADIKKQNPYVIRLKITPNKKLAVKDKIRGPIRINTNTLDDKVLIKSDGMPTYHFANVVDDHLMKITTVIRGEEWLPSLPFHKILYDAFNWNCPDFMHLPLILNATGKGKLSKRDSEKLRIPIFPLSWGNENIGYREKGFVPNGLINYLALLGWNDTTEKEIYSLKELENFFDFKKIQKSGAKFDLEKAKWINHNHIKKLSSTELLKIAEPWTKNLFNYYTKQKVVTIIKLVKERLVVLKDIKKETSFFVETPSYENINTKLFENPNSSKILKDLIKLFSSSKLTDNLKTVIINYGSQNNIKLGLLMQTLRTAIVGELSGPDIFLIIKILGKSVTLQRIKNLMSKINS